MHGKVQGEYNARLQRVIKRQCQFSMDNLSLVGMVLSGNGFSCAGFSSSLDQGKVTSKYLRCIRFPEANELLWQDHATAIYCMNSEPLRHLTKAGIQFVFGKEKKATFEKLRRYLSRLKNNHFMWLIDFSQDDECVHPSSSLSSVLQIHDCV